MVSKQPEAPAPTPADKYNDAYTNGQLDILPQKMTLAKSLLSSMPGYQSVGFDNPNVMTYNNELDKVTKGNAYNAAAKEFDTSAGNREFGSSYQAARTANLQNLSNKELAQNKLTALQTGQSIYNNDVNNALQLANFYNGAAPVKNTYQQYPTTSSGGLGSSLAIAGGSAAAGALSNPAVWSSLMSLSDIRTKKHIKKINSINGINIYEFEYKPEYNQPEGKHIGVMAQEVEAIIPGSVVEINGIKHVDYSKILPVIA